MIIFGKKSSYRNREMRETIRYNIKKTLSGDAPIDGKIDIIMSLYEKAIYSRTLEEDRRRLMKRYNKLKSDNCSCLDVCFCPCTSVYWLISGMAIVTFYSLIVLGIVSVSIIVGTKMWIY
jgi:hypothetical protein